MRTFSRVSLALVLCALAVIGFVGGAATYAQLSDTETAAVSVTAGTWTTTPAENNPTTETQPSPATAVSAEPFGVQSVGNTSSRSDVTNSNTTPLATPTETTVETPSTTAETSPSTPTSTATSTTIPVSTPIETATTTETAVDVSHPLANLSSGNETTASETDE